MELEAQVKSLPEAPFRSDGRTRDLVVGSIVALGSLVLAAPFGLQAVGTLGAFVPLMVAAYVALFVFALGGGHTFVTAEGVTMTLGVLPTSSRFFRRAHFHTVVVGVRQRPRRSTVTIELEVRKPTGGGTRYVIARIRTEEPARAFAERVLAPDARRVAVLLGALGPRWVES